ncbi:UDP-2,3-diacylglucosamine diphosphatase [Gammaproteobacteria bacterium]|nr:UDP-2,3-diacylglucosamine diphosphatase [Gammaproteobacteria bacterium]MDC3196520.1 UDP-2,3-diacylglucosamine diphosphatase [Gammaproteobacteria bacterium]MDC3267553.1 UDP-2,3-diacylglucosamine diphosphatase [bacterium]
MPRRILFISDLHLEEGRADITAALLAFLDRNESACDALYILGDLFEVWIGDDDSNELSARVAKALRSFHEAGADIFILHGNRDFLLGTDYAASCGATIIPDSIIITTPIGPAIVLHGDDLCSDDVQYMQFRTMVRQKSWQQDFLSKTLSERRAFAEQARRQSQQATSIKENAIMDVNPAAVEQRLREHGQTLMIHGHTHRPAIHEIELEAAIDSRNQARRVVLGDWDSHGWYAAIDADGLVLEKFPL